MLYLRLLKNVECGIDMSIRAVLERQKRELKDLYISGDEELYEYLYEDIQDKRLSEVFTRLHASFDDLFKFMNHKNNGSKHFNAQESRNLLDLISFYERMKVQLLKNGIDVKCNEYYENIVAECKKFLSTSYGSTIPNDFSNINIQDYEPIFIVGGTISLKTVNNIQKVSLKLIGEGSYAKVYKFKDPNYLIHLVKKQAKESLDTKELIRFKNEYTDTSTLNSPFIVKVFSYNEEENSYIMEYVHKDLEQYISSCNNTLNPTKRRILINQLLLGFEYMHKKKLLHRDISYKNILVKIYEDGTNMIKIADLGLVKRPNSDLTSLDSEIKGSINDYTDLARVGFSNYSIEHETFALTKVIYFILTGRKSFHKEKDPALKEFLEKGTHSDKAQRFKSVGEIRTFIREKIHVQ